MDHTEHMAANRRNWDDRARLHARPDTGYRLDRYRNDPTLVSDVIAFDQQYLGDLDGHRVLHLQCHIGTDTLGLARLGADVTGLDQSSVSLEAARSLFASVGTPGRFVESNVYDAVEALGGDTFDLVYTSVGVLNWLPDIARWGSIVAALVRPGGRLHLRESHPMAMSLDDKREDGLLCVKYPYFETDAPMTFDEAFTYVDTAGATVQNGITHEWNHGIGEVFTALADAGLEVTTLHEHRHLDWRFLRQQVEVDERFYLPDDQRDLIPWQYTLQAIKPR